MALSQPEGHGVRLAFPREGDDLPYMTERRFSDDEVAEILKRATTRLVPQQQRGMGTGLSLVELQEIGREVGIPVQDVTNAALSIDNLPTAPDRKVLGLPVMVRESVQLGRRLSKGEWEQMVVAARSTFAARGRIHSVGDFHEWTNGNLAMLLEPTVDGHQLRFQTRHESAEGMFKAGVIMTVSGGVMAALGLVTSAATTGTFIGTGGFLLAVGVVILGVAANILPRWSRERHEQMQSLCAKAQAMVQLAPAESNSPNIMRPPQE